MHDATLSLIRVSPLTLAELLMVRFLSHIERCPAALFLVVARLRFLRQTLGTVLGCQAAKRMSIAKAATLFLLVEHPADDAERLRLKALLIRTFLVSASPGNAGAMFAAGLQSDARRLGVLVGAEPPQGIVIPGIY